MSVIDLRRLEETTLWKHLSTGYQGADATVAKILSANLIAICDQAYQRMKAFPSLYPEYTLHDETHLLRVTELMAMVLGEDMINKLNPIEIAILILAAHFHDQGMVLEANEISSLSTDPKFVLFRQSWILDHPTLAEVETILSENNLSLTELKEFRSTEQQLLAALQTDYIRVTHGERSEKFILTQYGREQMWEISGVNLANYVAKLSASHVKPAFELNEKNNFNYDESIGTYNVNMVFLGIILRLADILDFDRDRTPDSLYRSIHFTSSVSLQEWEKHRSITGWNIDNKLIRFTASCEHPEYERAVRKFMDWIDTELSACHILNNKFPKAFENYKLDLPLVTNRDRIGPKNEAYIYHDLEFSLSRDQIVKLLMTSQLYGSANLCIRELLQNSLDALRLRRSVILRDLGVEWLGGKVHFEHFIDKNGYEIVRCTDTGIGMDEEIITKFLTSAGRSYYKSPEFEQERHSLRQSNADFNPIGQFGIGFMSCFMLGDRIKVFTKKDYGQGGGPGRNLLVEINGLGGIVTIREHESNLPVGTTVEIQCSKFEGVLNYFRTDTQVAATISEIVIATEFPIDVICTIPEHKREVAIPNSIFELTTPQEFVKFDKIVTDRFDFSELSKNLQGAIKQTFITSDISAGDSVEICLSNSEASLLPADKTKNHDGSIKRPYATWVFHKKDVATHTLSENISRISFDGIYICGSPGYEGRESKEYNYRFGYAQGIHHYNNPVGSGNTTFTLNVKGELKASLTPARGPGYYTYDRHLPLDWQRLVDYLSIGKARIYENLVAQKLGIAKPEIYWKLMIYNNFDVSYFRKGEVWKHLLIPCINENDEVSYLPMREMDTLSPFGKVNRHRYHALYTTQGLACAINDIDMWSPQGVSPRHDTIENLLIPFCSLSIQEGRYTLTPTIPTDSNELVGNLIIGTHSYEKIFLIPYLLDLSTYIMVITHGSASTANSNHPVIKLAFSAKTKSNKTGIEKLCLELLSLHRALEQPLLEAVANEAIPEALTNRLGLLYKMVNWNECANNLMPPYKIFFLSGNTVEITEDVLDRWSKQSFTCS